jgi:hypothetical protein
MTITELERQALEWAREQDPNADEEGARRLVAAILSA